jgi:RimJ/RimL family protein N-acetyltransferase
VDEPQSVRLFEQLNTGRLRLRPITQDDAPAVFAQYAADPQATRFLTFVTHQSLNTVEAFVQRCVEENARGQSATYAVEELKGAAFIGVVSLTIEDHRCGLGYVLGRRYWGKGYMTEIVRAVADWALSQPFIHRVWAVADIDNIASARVLEKSGFEREGILKRWSLHPNISPIPRDCWSYSRINK